MEEITSPFIDWAATTRSLAGEQYSGDAYAVKSWENKFLAAVIDGLGHGAHAAYAARIAAETLIERASEAEGEDGVVSLMKHCHEALLKTRGAVLSLALFNAADNVMTWIGVGNVDGILLHADSQMKLGSESLLRRGGVVGYRLSSLRPSTIPVHPGDILIFSTDGIRSGFEREVKLGEPPQQIADTIIANYKKITDDALVLVARYTGGPS